MTMTTTATQEDDMTAQNRSLIPGILLIVVGLLLLIPNFTDLRTRDFWPLFLLIGPGVVFVALFFANRENYGLLMPGTILIVVGLLLSYSVYTDWQEMRTLWPVFIIAPGLGFMMMYLFGKREKGLLVPGGILLGVGVVFLIGLSSLSYIWPIALIAIGLFLIIKAKRS